jgi:OOP family OmpA-OmpF porin
MKKVIAGLFVAATMATVSGAALAADSSFYGAVDLGQSKIKDVCVGMPAGVSCDDKDTAWRLAGGYNFNKNFGAEVSYTDYGNATASVLGVQFATASATAWQIVLARANIDVSVPILAYAASARNNNFVWGIGAQYDFTPSVGFRVNYENLGTVGDINTTGEAKLTNISAGVVFKF